MWDKHRQARNDSRKRAMRAAQARAVRRRGEALTQAAPEPEPEPAETQPERNETADEPRERAEPEASPDNPAGSLAWTGLILLTLILSGFMAAILFMLG